MAAPDDSPSDAVRFRHLARVLGWTRASYTLMGLFILICGLIVYLWWPLAQEYLALIDWSGAWWLQLDWLLIGIFVAMSLLIMAGADIRADLPMVVVGLAGGLVIESWGTQTALWTYYTFERPPLWIIPAWPIAGLSIDRLVRLSNKLVGQRLDDRLWRLLYVLVMLIFAVAMIFFIWPTITKSMTIAAVLLCAFLIVTPTGFRLTTLTFLAGAGLGYFLEVWGTTRLCWTYYTAQTPPFFAVLAHGMAAVAFWRVKRLYDQIIAPRLVLRARSRAMIAD